jgi:hypothetical protein
MDEIDKIDKAASRQDKIALSCAAHLSREAHLSFLSVAKQQLITNNFNSSNNSNNY